MSPYVLFVAADRLNPYLAGVQEFR
jgi:hypothetical protein